MTSVQNVVTTLLLFVRVFLRCWQISVTLSTLREGPGRHWGPGTDRVTRGRHDSEVDGTRLSKEEVPVVPSLSGKSLLPRKRNG